MNLVLQLNQDVQKSKLESFTSDLESKQGDNFKTLTFDELREIEGGFIGTILAVGAAAAACVAIYEAGKAVGEVVYHATH